MGSAASIPDAPPLVREALRFRRTVERPAALVATFRTAAAGTVAESAGDFWKGSFDGALGMLQQARVLNPFDPYNLTHPSQYAENIGNLAASTVAAGKAFISDPIGTGKAMIGAGIDSFTKDPFGPLGKLAPEVAAGLATGGSSTAGSMSRRALDTVTDFLGDKSKIPLTIRTPPRMPTHPHQPSRTRTRPPKIRKWATKSTSTRET